MYIYIYVYMCVYIYIYVQIYIYIYTGCFKKNVPVISIVVYNITKRARLMKFGMNTHLSHMNIEAEH